MNGETTLSCDESPNAAHAAISSPRRKSLAALPLDA